MKDFVNLHTHSIFSIGDSLIRIPDLFNKVKELGQSAIALTDHSTLAGAWDGLQEAKKTGVKFIIGSEFNFVNNLADEKEKLKHIVLIAKNHQGYKNLLKLLKKANENNIIAFKKTYPRLDWNLLEQYSEGLLCGTACSGGIIGQLINIRKPDEAKQQAIRLKNIFGDNLYFEIMPNALKRQVNQYNDYMDQQLVNTMLIQWGKELDVKLVPTCNAHYLNKEDSEAHDVILAISSGQPIESNNRLRYPVPEFYLKSRDEVVNFFKRLYKEEAEEWADNSVYFADQCEFPEWIDPAITFGNKILPDFKVSDQPDYLNFIQWKSENENFSSKKEDSNYLRFKCYQALSKLNIESSILNTYVERIEKELDVFDEKDINSYILIVADYINWCRNNNIPVGPGRGCVSAETLILTENGFKEIKDVTLDDKVYTSDGTISKILNKFEYDIDEETISLKVEGVVKPLILTKDHKLLCGNHLLETIKKQYDYSTDKKVCKSNRKWSKKTNVIIKDYKCANEIKENKDFIYTKIPIRQNIKSIKIDLAEFSIHASNKQKILLDDNYIYINRTIVAKESDIFSIRNISRTLNINFDYVRKLKINKNKIQNELFNFKINNFLNENKISLEEWKSIPTHKTLKINRFITIDKDFAYLLGRWVGDGSFHGGKKYKGINIAFNKDDTLGIKKISKICDKLGWNYSHNPSSSCNALTLTISSYLISYLFKYIFPKYEHTSLTKHLPYFFRSLDNDVLNSLLEGLLDSDGHKINTNYFRHDTISPQLSLELRELCIYLGKSHIQYEVEASNIYRNNKKSYKTHIRTFELKEYLKPIKTKTVSNNVKKVYDLFVEDNNSYLTLYGVIHNSVGGSLVAYLLDIHKADSIKYSLIFERFYNKFKDNFSDIDVDFSREHKKNVEQYIASKYGVKNFGSISNYLQLTPKPYVKAIARVFRYGGDFKTAVKIGNEIASIIPDDIHSIKDAFDKSPLLNEYAKQYPELKKFANTIGNIYIALATHAGGKIITSYELDSIVPIRHDHSGAPVIEYEKNRAELNGLVKMDILGLETLDIIKNTYDLIKLNNKIPPKEPFDYELYDQKTYDLISSGNNYGIFQLGESAGTIALCKEIKPKCISDLSLINALARPSAVDIRKDFIELRKTNQKANLLHPKLERAFGFTNGFGLFEESLMMLAQDLAGWNLNEADKLRKLTKEKGKNPEKVAKWRQEFIEGCISTGVGAEIGIRVWDEVISNFQGYGFNNAHSVLYSLISFQTAYLKAHFPIEFMVANLQSEVNSNAKKSKDNILKIKQELRASGVKILPPDLNKSEMTYSILDDKHLLTGFESLKFMGKDAIPEILRKRPFTDFFDFISRVEPSKVKMPSILALIASGCLDGSGLTRKQMFLYAADYRKKLQLFKERTIDPNKTFVYPFPEIGEWSIPELHAQEQYYLGEGLTGNPFEVYAGFLNKLAINFSQLMSEFSSFPTSADKKNIYIPRDYGVIQGIVESFFTFKVKKAESKIYGQEMAKMVIKDPWGNSLSCTLFPDALTSFRATIKKLKGGRFVIEPGIGLHLTGHLNEYEGQVNLVYQDVLNVCGLPQRPTDLKPKKVTLKIPNERKKAKKELEIADVIEEYEEILSENGVIEEEALAEEELWQEIESSQPTLEMDD